ncbi:MAG: hypothetical protein DMD37_10920 [Gemmatimonadetes bacterium]|nr:MAG: hypothetical protein DMD29_01220 [Gemmatimonadota bacterium]PYO81000.1 MAG: hypothetical protein DMD68_14010 [Gemmatimonadota bacterium]PYP62225.1 MAG: hypothetical protein DMD37_10920 [Gemmatimonadota bacterium]
MAPHRDPPGLVRPAALRGGVPPGGRVIDEKAQELGRLLGQSDEYKALKRASERLREDAECRTKLEELERLASELERAGAGGKEPTREQVEKYDQLLQSVQANPVYQQMVAAQANFEKMMARVNERIYDGIKKGSASPIITLG